MTNVNFIFQTVVKNNVLEFFINMADASFVFLPVVKLRF